jgi:hypothetical protein
MTEMLGLTKKIDFKITTKCGAPLQKKRVKSPSKKSQARRKDSAQTII